MVDKFCAPCQQSGSISWLVWLVCFTACVLFLFCWYCIECYPNRTQVATHPPTHPHPHTHTHTPTHTNRVGQNHIYISIVYTAFPARESRNIRSCTLYIYSSGHPCDIHVLAPSPQITRAPPSPFPSSPLPHIYRVGQDHIYTVHTRHFWQGNLEIYGHIRCIYTALAILVTYTF